MWLAGVEGYLAPSMRLRSLIVTTIGLGILAWSGCRKDAALVDEAHFPTPFVLDVPPWVFDSVVPMLIPPNDPLTVEGVALGRRLFHDKALSAGYTQSCATCHVQASGFTDPLAFSVGDDGSVGTRNAMAVINLAWHERFFWDGRRPSLELQAHDPVTNPIEMRNTWPVVVQRLQADPAYPPLFEVAFGTAVIDSNLVTRAIAQFERTLLSFRSRFDRYRYEGDTTALNSLERHGMSLFFGEAHCGDCHSRAMLSDGFLRNNGLGYLLTDMGQAEVTGEIDHRGKFKVPTLRNIAVSGPYMHDSRFTTLVEVVDFYAEGVRVNDPQLDPHMLPWLNGEIDLDPQERADLVAFLLTLTDETFLTNPAFGAP